MTDTPRFAALDIGSNTVRLLVAETHGPSFKLLYAEQVITRLGKGAYERGTLSEDAIERTLSGVQSLIDGAAPQRPYKIAATATHAVRNAGNRKNFACRFKERFGFGLNVIDQQTEATLALLGAEKVLGAKLPVLLFDIGGGSTEFIYRKCADSVELAGTDLGVVRLAETYIKNAPMIEEEYEVLYTFLRGEIKKVAHNLNVVTPFTLAGTAGTITSMAAIHFHVYPYDPDKINNSKLSIDDVRSLLQKVGSKTLEERSKLPELENGREDLIVPGIGIVLAVMETFGCDTITVCDSGLREGILHSVIDGTMRAYDIK